MFTKVLNIKGCKTCKQVIIAMYRGEDESGVEIFAWHTNNDGDYYQWEAISIEDDAIAKRFVADYSEVSANDFANSFTF